MRARFSLNLLLTDSWFRWVYHFLGASRTFSNFKYIVHISLNFDDYKESPKRKKSLGVLIGIGAIIGVIALGSTLAANINLNTGNPVEFGQGVAQTTACDDSVILTPESTFVNADCAGDYLFTSITVSDISEACYGKEFSIKAYKNGENSALPLYITNGTDTYNSIRVFDDAGSFSLVEAGLLSDDITNTTSGFKVTFVTSGPPQSIALASAQDVDRITIESKENAPDGSLSFNSNSILYDANNAFKFGLNDFTIESWAYISSSQSNHTIYDTGRQVNDLGGLALWVETDKLKYRINGCWWCGANGFDVEVPMGNWYDSWHHYALTRNAGIERLFVDGVLVASSYDKADRSATGINTIELTRNSPSIGQLDNYYNDFYLSGKIEAIRVINGAAKYLANFTPPQKFTNEAGTVLLVDATKNATKFVDQSDYHWVPSQSSVLPTWWSDHR